MAIEIFNRQRRVTGFDTRSLRGRAQTVADAADIGEAEVCVTLVSDRRIHVMNRSWRSVDRPTDVLSFPQNEGEFAGLNAHVLGDIVISLETAERQRTTRSLLDEATHLLIHGLLHLLGHDHQEDAEAEVMEAEERRLWSALGR